MDEGKERVKRQLPKIPGKSSRKSRSSGNITKQAGSASASFKSPHSSSGTGLANAVALLNFSPPGTKNRDFLGYSLVSIDGSDGENASVTVAVRVRPFSEREIRLGAKQTIRINDKELVITGKENKINHFCYDHCFWSFDKNSPDFANQETVYQCLAQPLLESAFEGYNTCLFAYGQTGSGKSYCIMGEADSPGVIPQFAEELFERITMNTDADVSFKVEVSYYEIYKERIHDLLASSKQKSRVRLRVREHPVMGPYVEDLSTYVASTYSDIEQWLALGNRFRATAATGMNDRSSRSHSVFTMVLTQAKTIDGEDHSRVSRINLIDLAGSERSSVSNTSGERLQEGASINKSLHTLSKVISLLAERSTGKRKKVYIPYRDSTLTWLLKESLGGNSKTAMIATVSPADLHQEESLSTLRYAQQARSIINVARVNEDPQSKLIRDLRQEIEWLRSRLSNETDTSVDMTEILKNKEEMHQMKDKLNEYEKLMEEMTRSWEERLRRTEDRKLEEAEQLKRAGVSFKVDNKLPNLVNLNEDPQLSEMLLYVLKEGVTTVGRNTESDIQLTGALVAKNHCTIENKGGEVTLHVYPSEEEEAQTFINGTLLSLPTVLHHGDRVVVAGEHFFRFNHPLQVEQGAGRTSTRGRNFEFARDEYVQAQTERLEAERLRERQEMMEKLEAVKEAADQELSIQKQSYEEKLRSLEGTLAEKNLEVSVQLQQQEMEAEEKILLLEKQKKELEEETIAQRHIIELERVKTQQEYEEMEEQSSRLMRELEQEKIKLESDIDSLQKNKERRQKPLNDSDSLASSMDLIHGSELLRMATMVQEANVISKSLMKPFHFAREDFFENDEVIQKIKVTNTKLKKVTVWNMEKFETRLEQMRELYQHSGSVTNLDQDGFSSEDWLVGDSDPFHDPQDEWVHDSLLTYNSPLSSADGRQHSMLSIFTPPGSAHRRTPHSSVSDLPKRVLLGASVTNSPAVSSFTSPTEQSPFTSPVKQAAQTITQICYDKVAMLLNYQHNPSTSIFNSMISHVQKLKSMIRELSVAPKDDVVMELYLCLQLLFDSAKNLEMTLKVRGAEEGILTRVHCCSLQCLHQLIEHITRHTALYSSRLLQAFMSDSEEECRESISNIEESGDGILSLVGQISLCLRVEGRVCERQEPDPALEVPTEQDFVSFFQYGYQTWCSTLLEGFLRSLHLLLEQLQSVESDPTAQGLREVLGHVIQLLYQITEVQELFYDMADEETLDLVINILSNVWRTFISLDTMCSLILKVSSPPSSNTLVDINQRISVWAEQTAISLVSFLRQTSSEDPISEVQAIAKSIAMATRSFNQYLKQKSIIAPLEGYHLTPQKSQEIYPTPLPPDIFLHSPSPPSSSSSSSPSPTPPPSSLPIDHPIQDNYNSSDTSLV